MIGNDLIHLPGWPRRAGSRRKRFLEKVFTPGERRWISQAEDSLPAEAWLWSIKESAYKLQRPSPVSRRWAPKEYTCELEGRNCLEQGSMRVGGRRFFFRSIWTATELHTILVDPLVHPDWLSWKVQDKRLNYLPATGVKLQKDHWAVPYGIQNGRRIPCSRSHDGGRHALAWVQFPATPPRRPAVLPRPGEEAGTYFTFY